MLYLCECFYVVIIWLVNGNGKKEVILYSQYYKSSKSKFFRHLITQQTRETSTMPIQCQSTIYDAGPAPNQH